MRLWSIHPEYLDCRGLVALWREGLLARRVLEGKIRGYQHHPQLARFRSYSAPLAAINSYLYYVYLEAGRRGYNFARHKVSIRRVLTAVIPVTEGQINFEYRHLGKKLMKRDREKLAMLRKSRQGIIRVNPLFYVIPGRIEEWERSAV